MNCTWVGPFGPQPCLRIRHTKQTPFIAMFPFGQPRNRCSCIVQSKPRLSEDIASVGQEVQIIKWREGLNTTGTSSKRREELNDAQCALRGGCGGTQCNLCLWLTRKRDTSLWESAKGTAAPGTVQTTRSSLCSMMCDHDITATTVAVRATTMQVSLTPAAVKVVPVTARRCSVAFATT